MKRLFYVTILILSCCVLISCKSQEQKAQELVRQTYQVEVSEDEADAICLGTAALKEKEQNRSAF